MIRSRRNFIERYYSDWMDTMKKRKHEQDGSFLLVTQKEWEKDVIWDAENFGDKLSKKNTSSVCWIPTLHSRKDPYYTPPPENDANGTLFKIMEEEAFTQIASESNKITNDEPPQRAISFLPIENPDLVNGRWEDDIIWDAEEEDPELWRPLVPCFDAGDDNIVVNFPSDSVDVVDGIKSANNKITKPRVNPHTSTSKKLIAEVFGNGDHNTSADSEVDVKLDPYNISNDEYYKLGSSQMSMSTFSNRQQFVHTKPVQDFHPLLFPESQFHYYALRGYHRPSVRQLLTPRKLYSIQTVHKFAAQMKKKNEIKLRKEEKLKKAGEPVPKTFSPFDSILELTGRYGEIILIEYCEQFPPLLSQVGMHSKITNYVQKRRKVIDVTMKYGEFSTAKENTFLGQLGKDAILQTLENNLYRCPIYEHPVKSDFLVIRVGDNLFVREIDAVFTGGQQSPMIIVPQPKSKASTVFTKSFLKVSICRFLRSSKSFPKTVHMTDIKSAFPNVSENSIRKVLNDLAEYKRGGMTGTWKVRSSPQFSLPSESEMASLISPEQYCAHYSSESAELRLKMLGYSEKHFLSKLKVGDGNNENNEEIETTKVEEVNCAPWNTTRAFLSAVKGSCLLEVNGPADPTGCGEGFSYIRTSNKAITVDPEQKKCINGTKVDLRKLGVLEARKLLKSSGVPESQYKKLSRWEMIDVIKTLSSEKVLEGENASGFSRVNPLSTAERQKKNRRDRQHIFDLQNRVLGSSEVLSSDNDNGDSDVSDIEEAGKQLEEMLTKNISQEQVDLEAEERERSSLIKMLMEEKKDGGDAENKNSKKKRVLKICRTYNTNGGSYTMTETVRNQDVIEIYEKIQRMGSQAEQFLRTGILKRGADRLKANEKRLEVDRARRLKKKEQKEAKRMGDELYGSKAKKNKGKLLPAFDKKCGACGEIGHLRTNSCCPKFVPKKKPDGKRKGRPPGIVLKIKLAKKEEPQLSSGSESDSDSDSESES